MFIEDIVLVLEQTLTDSTLRYSLWERSFLTSVAGWVRANRPLSVKQAETLHHLITSHTTTLVRRLGQPAVTAALDTPTYRHPLFESHRVPREVRHLGDNLLGFRFKLDQDIKSQLRHLYDPHGRRALNAFDWRRKLWIVPVTARNLRDIRAFIAQHGFAADRALLAYLDTAAETQGRPAVGVLANEIILLTVPDNALLAAWASEIGGGVSL
jgi:hypothetical protein